MITLVLSVALHLYIQVTDNDLVMNLSHNDLVMDLSQIII